NGVWLQLNQFVSSAANARYISTAPTSIDLNIATLRPTKFLKTCDKSRKPPLFLGIAFGSWQQYPYTSHSIRLLRACSKRRRGGSGANERHKLAPPHSITSSAIESTPDGISMPSACAVCKLSAKLNLVDCSTGRSAGLAPLRIIPV